MQTLSIDIETYSGVNLSKCGVYKYAESPDSVSYTHLDVCKRQP